MLVCTAEEEVQGTAHCVANTQGMPEEEKQSTAKGWEPRKYTLKKQRHLRNVLMERSQILAKNMQKSHSSNNTSIDKVNEWMKPSKIKLKIKNEKFCSDR